MIPSANALNHDSFVTSAIHYAPSNIWNRRGRWVVADSQPLGAALISTRASLSQVHAATAEAADDLGVPRARHLVLLGLRRLRAPTPLPPSLWAERACVRVRTRVRASSHSSTGGLRNAQCGGGGMGGRIFVDALGPIRSNEAYCAAHSAWPCGLWRVCAAACALHIAYVVHCCCSLERPTAMTACDSTRRIIRSVLCLRSSGRQSKAHTPPHVCRMRVRFAAAVCVVAACGSRHREVREQNRIG
jgi:hypothetical protein